MTLKAKDLIRILSAVDGDSDVVFHLVDADEGEQENERYGAEYVTIKEGQTYEGDYKESEMTIHIGLYYTGCYDPYYYRKCEPAPDDENDRNNQKCIF